MHFLTPFLFLFRTWSLLGFLKEFSLHAIFSWETGICSLAPGVNYNGAKPLSLLHERNWNACSGIIKKHACNFLFVNYSLSSHLFCNLSKNCHLRLAFYQWCSICLNTGICFDSYWRRCGIWMMFVHLYTFYGSKFGPFPLLDHSMIS